MDVFNVKDKLPEDGSYVLAHFPGKSWGDRDAKGDEHKWVVVKFVRGLSKSERAALPTSDERKRIYKSADEDSNNTVPYFWNAFGPSDFFGQECSVWCELPSYTVGVVCLK